MRLSIPFGVGVDVDTRLLFVDSGPGSGGGGGASCRLLLHGSAQHLLGWTPRLTDGPTLNETDGGDSVGAVFLDHGACRLWTVFHGPKRSRQLAPLHSGLRCPLGVRQIPPTHRDQNNGYLTDETRPK